MNHYDRSSFGFSLMIACLIIPLVLISYGYEIARDFGVFTLGLYIPSMIIYLIGTYLNKNNLIKLGFSLGLPAWILNIVTAISSIIDLSLIQINTYTIFYILLNEILGMQIFILPFHNTFILPVFVYSDPLTILMILNIISGSICIILGSIIFERRQEPTKTIEKNESWI